MMRHRTQILLDDWQYEALKEESARLKISFSSLIRKGMDQFLARTPRSRNSLRKGLQSFAGIIKHEKPGLGNSDIDRLIYRKDWE